MTRLQDLRQLVPTAIAYFGASICLKDWFAFISRNALASGSNLPVYNESIKG
jgi:hypothetical protein